MIKKAIEITSEEFSYAEKKIVSRGYATFEGKDLYGFFTSNYFYYAQNGFCYYLDNSEL